MVADSEPISAPAAARHRPRLNLAGGSDGKSCHTYVPRGPNTVIASALVISYDRFDLPLAYDTRVGTDRSNELLIERL